MSEWQDIKTAQTRGSYQHRDGHARTWTEAPTVDILAKRWNIDTDAMEFRRFPDCRFEDEYWQGVVAGWRPVAWMPLPTIPTEWPPTIKPAEIQRFGDQPPIVRPPHNPTCEFADDKEMPF